MVFIQKMVYPDDLYLRSTDQDEPCFPNILIIGDSVDRLIVQRFCESRGTHSIDWADGIFRTRRFDSVLCRTSHGCISHLHVYGSNATGPYFAGVNTTEHDPYAGTQARIRKGLELFTYKLGPPTIVVFQIVAWDLSRLMRDRALSDPTKLAEYRDNMAARVREILALKPNATTLLLRTAPASNFAKGLMHAYNAVLRNLSREMGVGLVDFDRMLWAAPAGRAVAIGDLFKDNVHPHRRFLARFGEHLIELSLAAQSLPAAVLHGGSPEPFLREDDFEGWNATSANLTPVT
jgi:hypothetical protein